MYSRLYTHILNHFPQIDHCASFHHIYTDSSLFGLFASFVPSSGRQANAPAHIFPHLVHQLSLLLYSNLPQAELSRAKNQLKSSLMMALESRAVEVEDLGRQVNSLAFCMLCGDSCCSLGSCPWPQDSCLRDVREDRRRRRRRSPPGRCTSLRPPHLRARQRRRDGSGGRRRLSWGPAQVWPRRRVSTLSRSRLSATAHIHSVL